jgi:hypothetical protein
MSASFDHHIKGPGGCQFPQWFWSFKVQIRKCIIPLTPTLSPAFAEAGSRRQAPGERRTIELFSNPDYLNLYKFVQWVW